MHALLPFSPRVVKAGMKVSRMFEEATMDQGNATRAFLGDEAQWSAARVDLYDVQALWGGHRIYVEGTKRVVVRRVLTGRLEHRYEFELSADEWKRLLDLFVEN